MPQKLYRQRAKLHLDRAKKKLDQDEEEHLSYVALELRMALEAIVYDRINVYADALDQDAFNTWQPPKLMKLLASVAPNANENCIITITTETKPGKPAAAPIRLGTESVYPSQDLKKDYNKLGNYLHVPTIKQIDEHKEFDEAKAMTAFKAIIEKLSSVLDSTARNIKIGNRAQLDCIRCGKTIIKGIYNSETSIQSSCFSCPATYTLIREEKKVRWEPNQISFNCPREECAAPCSFWIDEVAVGNAWTCEKCQSKWVFAFGVSPDKGQPLFNPTHS